MALIDCKECGHSVSTEAAACPSCGAPLRLTPVNGSTGSDEGDQSQPTIQQGAASDDLNKSWSPGSSASSNAVLLIVMLALIGGGFYFFVEGDSWWKGDDWSHDDLIQHLKSKDFHFVAEETIVGALLGPGMLFKFGDDEVFVHRAVTVRVAKDHALEHGGFAWKRFTFFGGGERLMERLRIALR